MSSANMGKTGKCDKGKGVVNYVTSQKNKKQYDFKIK